MTMDVQTFLDMLGRGEDPETYDASGDTHLKGHKEEPKFTHHKDHHHEVKSGKQQEFNNKDLEDFINYTGFKTEEMPRFTEIAKRLGNSVTLDQKDTVKDLTSLDNHDIIEDVSPITKNDNNERELHKAALRKLIAKYKG
jgi:hypothetical protein